MRVSGQEVPDPGCTCIWGVAKESSRVSQWGGDGVVCIVDFSYTCMTFVPNASRCEKAREWLNAHDDFESIFRIERTE